MWKGFPELRETYSRTKLFIHLVAVFKDINVSWFSSEFCTACLGYIPKVCTFQSMSYSDMSGIQMKNITDHLPLNRSGVARDNVRVMGKGREIFQPKHCGCTLLSEISASADINFTTIWLYHTCLAVGPHFVNKGLISSSRGVGCNYWPWFLNKITAIIIFEMWTLANC